MNYPAIPQNVHSPILDTDCLELNAYTIYGMNALALVLDRLNLHNLMKSNDKIYRNHHIQCGE